MQYIDVYDVPFYQGNFRCNKDMDNWLISYSCNLFLMRKII